MNSAHETIIPHQAAVRATTHIRSTLLQSSLASLRARGHYEKYLQLLDGQVRDEIVNAIAPGWLPITLAVAHYQACDELKLSETEVQRIGEGVGDRVHGTYMATLTRGARNVGVTPWLLLKRFDTLWGRVFQGGSIQLTKTGPKDLTIEIRGAQVTSSDYFRTSFCGVVRAGYKYVGVRTAFVRIASYEARADRFAMSAAWV